MEDEAKKKRKEKKRKTTEGVGFSFLFTVVDLVVGGRVEDPLERPQLTNDFGVQPELVQQVQLQVHQVVRRWDDDGHGYIAELIQEIQSRN